MKLHLYLTLFTKINLTYIKDLSIIAEAIKHLKEKIGNKLFDMDLGNDLKYNRQKQK